MKSMCSMVLVQSSCAHFALLNGGNSSPKTSASIIRILTAFGRSKRMLLSVTVWCFESSVVSLDSSTLQFNESFTAFWALWFTSFWCFPGPAYLYRPGSRGIGWCANDWPAEPVTITAGLREKINGLLWTLSDLRLLLPFFAQGLFAHVSLVANLQPPIASGHVTTEHSIRIEDCSKCTSELMLDCRAVTTSIWIAPRHNWAISQDRRKCTPCGVNLLHTLQLILDGRAITTTIWIALRYHRAIFQDRGKCSPCGLNLLHAYQLALDCRAVTTMVWMAPCYNSVAAAAPQCKGPMSGCQLWLFHTPCKLVASLQPCSLKGFQRIS